MTDTLEPTVDDSSAEPTSSRRHMLKLAGAAVAGGTALAVAGARPAGADDGDPVLLGTITNNATVSTFINMEATDPVAALVVENTSTLAADKGPDVKCNGTGRLAQVPALSGLAEPTFNIIQNSGADAPAHEIVRTTNGLIWASTGSGTGNSTLWKRMNTVRVDTASGSGAAFAPFRFIDTRNGTGGISGVRNVGGTTNWNVVNHAAIPNDAIGIMGNLTVTGSNYSGWVNIWPRGVAEPVTSSINFTTGQTIANFFCVGLGTGGNAGQISIGPRKGGGGTGSVHVILDITAYIQ